MAEVVDRELALPARANAAQRRGHDACGGDHDVEAAGDAPDSLGSAGNGAQVPEVEAGYLLDPVRRRCRAGTPDRCNHPGTRSYEGLDSLRAEAGRAAGDQGDPTGQVDALQGVGGVADRVEAD
ncbi:hypothetical protein MHY29_01150 [Micrococcus sp. ACRRV]|nr:hypothetical protein [Micrococcus sp. ACRRV]MCG7421458.1 hypothetical protein [Micrococcus sp. ACRRV]